MSGEPYLEARGVYEREECGNGFEFDLGWHLARGYVWATPEVFCMARLVRGDWSDDELVDVSKTAPFGGDVASHEVGDALHIWLCAGAWWRVFELFALERVPISVVTFERENQVRRYDFRRIARCSVVSCKR